MNLVTEDSEKPRRSKSIKILDSDTEDEDNEENERKQLEDTFKSLSVVGQNRTEST